MGCLATTVVEVISLLDANMLIEIEAIALVQGRWQFLALCRVQWLDYLMYGSSKLEPSMRLSYWGTSPRSGLFDMQF
jgi:hypothetical protein